MHDYFSALNFFNTTQLAKVTVELRPTILVKNVKTLEHLQALT